MRPSDELRAGSEDLWAAQLRHPFVRGIADGTLPVGAYAAFVRQDHAFLVDYARALSLAAARAPDLPTMAAFADLARAVLHDELELHRGVAAELGIGREELEATRAEPLTRAYVDFLLRTAALGEVAELAAALLPCMWGYAELGAALAAEARPAGRPARYDAWIATYADPGFAALATWCRELVDRLAHAAGPEGRVRMAEAFRTCSAHELAFWDVGLVAA